MAEIVMGIGTSHGSQVSLTPEWWPKHGELDRKRTPYDELIKNARTGLADELTPEVWQRKYDATQVAVAELSEVLKAADPDCLIVVGDDQAELFSEHSMPAIAVFWGSEIVDLPRDLTDVPASRAAAMWAKHATEREAYPVPAALGKHIVEHLVGVGFDITQMDAQPEGHGVGHAFTFVRLRLMGEQIIPILPVMLNTYFPPNQPTAARCYALGQAIRDAVAAWPEDLRVGVVASGGLSHFVVDEELDRDFLDAVAKHDGDAIGAIPESKLQSGSSEIKNWIVAAGALSNLQFSLIDYVPGYRSQAGTGCGMAFGRWS
jgi:3-O-methylgallate 3,4-dioxygenase